MVVVGRAEAAVRFMPPGGICQRGKPNATFALEELVLVIEALYLSIQQVDLLCRFQSDALQRLLVAGDNPRRGTCELELQRLADVRVQIHDVLVLPQPLAVGRVNQHQCTLRALLVFDFFKANLLDVDILLHACRAYILQRGLYGIESGI